MRRSAARRRRGDDTGATSVVFALVAMVILAVAALAVDLTNLYSQRAVAQSRADAAAFAGAQALPDACAAVEAARASLQDTGGRRALTEPVGEVVVYATDPEDQDGDPATAPLPPSPLGSTAPSCSTSGASVQVRTAPRRVPFVFAGVLDLFEEGSGSSGATVSAVARVRLAEPDLMPFVLPRDCLGETYLLTSTPPPPPPPPPEPTPEPTPSPPPSPPPPPVASGEPSDEPSADTSDAPTTADPGEPAEPSPPDEVPVTPAPQDPTPSPDPTADQAPGGGPTDAVPADPTADSEASVGGSSLLQPRAPSRFVPRMTPAPGCAAVQDAGLGVLDSPVRDGTTGDAGLLLNVRDGIDHAIEPLDADTDEETRCSLGSPPGAVPDLPRPDGTPNCVLVRPLPDPARVVIALRERLDHDPDLTGCGSAPVTGRAFETLAACYLLDGADRADVLDPGGLAVTPSLDEAILADPRFFVVAEIELTEADDSGRLVPVRALRGAFATDDGELSRTGTLPAFVFPLEALPEMVVDPDADRPRTLVLTTPVPRVRAGGTG